MSTIPRVELSPDEALRTGLLECLDVSWPKHSPKFSFDPNAVYEDLAALQKCPFQGYFYSDDEEELEYGVIHAAYPRLAYG